MLNKCLKAINKVRKNKDKATQKTNKYNWISDIVRVEGQSSGIKSNYVTPQRIKNSNQYKEKLMSWIISLQDEFSKKEVDSEYIETIKSMRKALDNILEEYYMGNISSSYNMMKNIISEMKEKTEGVAISSIQTSIAFNDLEDVLSNENLDNQQIEFFRARTSNKYCMFNRNEMLHIPFNMRKRVASTRFSIPGLPCLYLATTSYCCWLELGTPTDYQFNVSAVKVNQESKILNLTMNADLFEGIIMLQDKYKISKKYVIEALKLWILSYASSFKVDEDDRSFKEEYIISQLIMLVSKDLGLDGVAYYSKQVEDDRFAHMLSVNLALFAKFNREKRFSEICKNIEISPSYNYAMFKQLGPGEKYKSKSISLHITRSRRSNMIGIWNRQSEYIATDFYEFDRFLFSHIKSEIEKIDVDKENSM